MNKISHSTRELLLQAAEVLFAERGFYGVSITDIANELTLTKQGLLHHFPTKEKIYLAVLEEAVTYLDGHMSAIIEQAEGPIEQIFGICEFFSTVEDRLICVSRLLVRELLDNPKRAKQSRKWLLAPFLSTVETILINGQKQGLFAPVHAMAFIFQILGAQQYFIISLPTLKKMHDPEAFQSHVDNHIKETKRIIEKTLLLDNELH